jgi:hypothetical protein
MLGSEELAVNAPGVGVIFQLSNGSGITVQAW